MRGGAPAVLCIALLTSLGLSGCLLEFDLDDRRSIPECGSDVDTPAPSTAALGTDFAPAFPRVHETYSPDAVLVGALGVEPLGMAERAEDACRWPMTALIGDGDDPRIGDGRTQAWRLLFIDPHEPGSHYTAQTDGYGGASSTTHGPSGIWAQLHGGDPLGDVRVDSETAASALRDTDPDWAAKADAGTHEGQVMLTNWTGVDHPVWVFELRTRDGRDHAGGIVDAVTGDVRDDLVSSWPRQAERQAATSEQKTPADDGAKSMTFALRDAGHDHLYVTVDTIGSVPAGEARYTLVTPTGDTFPVSDDEGQRIKDPAAGRYEMHAEVPELSLWRGMSVESCARDVYWFYDVDAGPCADA